MSSSKIILLIILLLEILCLCSVFNFIFSGDLIVKLSFSSLGIHLIFSMLLALLLVLLVTKNKSSLESSAPNSSSLLFSNIIIFLVLSTFLPNLTFFLFISLVFSISTKLLELLLEYFVLIILPLSVVLFAGITLQCLTGLMFNECTGFLKLVLFEALLNISTISERLFLHERNKLL